MVQADAYLVAVQPGRAGVHFAVGAELDEALRGLRGRGAAGPDGAGRGDLGDVEAFGGTNGDSTGHRLDVEDVAGLAVAGRGADPQAAALADGEGVGAVVLAEDGAGLVDDLAWRLAQVLGQEAAGVAVGDEADVVAVRLVRDREPAPRGLGADLSLRRVAEGEHGVADLLGGEHGQHVGLVLAGIRSAVQDAVTDPRVVAGAYRVEPEGQRTVEHRRELDLLVAAQARVRGAARGVLGDEILHHVAMESLGHVPHVERDPDDVGGPARVPGILQRAAAPRPGPVGRRVGGQRQMDAGHLVTRVHRTRRGRRGVHSARHGREHLQTAHRLNRLRDSRARTGPDP